MLFRSGLVLTLLSARFLHLRPYHSPPLTVLNHTDFFYPPVPSPSPTQHSQCTAVRAPLFRTDFSQSPQAQSHWSPVGTTSQGISSLTPERHLPEGSKQMALSLQAVGCCGFSFFFSRSKTRSLLCLRGSCAWTVGMWPSGLRRWIKAPVSSGAWVRIPPLPGGF